MSKNKVALESIIRKKINAHIVEYPGVSFSTLKKFYDLNESTLRYHLHYLRRAKRITSNIENGTKHYYPYRGTENVSNPMNTDLKTPKLTAHQEKILNVIKQYPGINQTELISKTSLKRHILSYNTSKLVDIGMVRRINHENYVCYEYIPDELLEYEMLKVLTIRFLNNEIDEQTYLKLREKLKKD
jgi:predicted transcriptional regulator